MKLHAEKVPILVVDDQPNNLLVMESLLAEMSLPLQIFTAEDGQRALRLSLQQSFALILLDVQMPGMNGYEVAEMLRSYPKTSGVPIIFVTAGMNAELHVIQGYESGAVDYLPKPLDRRQLTSKVRVFCELYQQRRILELSEQHLESEVNRRSAELQLLNAQLEQRVEERSQELKLALSRVVEAERHKALNNMVVGVAHEMNTPIGVVLLAATALRAEMDRLNDILNSSQVSRSSLMAISQQCCDGVSLIENNALRAAKLVNNFKALGCQVESELPIQFDLDAIILDELAVYKQKLDEAGVTVDVTVGVGLIVRGFPDSLQRAIGILIENSLFHAFLCTPHPSIYLSAHVESGQLTLIYRDNGCGVKAEDLPRLFDPFFTSRLGQGSSGLGLSTLHSLIVEKMGGVVRVRSDAGEGLCFEFNWPKLLD
jgi:signal transduction histidine kinase